MPLSGLQICWVSLQLRDQGIEEDVLPYFWWGLRSLWTRKTEYIVWLKAGPRSNGGHAGRCPEPWMKLKCRVRSKPRVRIGELLTRVNEEANQGRLGTPGRRPQWSCVAGGVFSLIGQNLLSTSPPPKISWIRMSWVCFQNIPNISKHARVFVSIHRVYCVHICIASVSLFKKYINRIVPDTVKGYGLFFFLHLALCLVDLYMPLHLD